MINNTMPPLKLPPPRSGGRRRSLCSLPHCAIWCLSSPSQGLMKEPDGLKMESEGKHRNSMRQRILTVFGFVKIVLRCTLIMNDFQGLRMRPEGVLRIPSAAQEYDVITTIRKTGTIGKKISNAVYVAIVFEGFRDFSGIPSLNPDLVTMEKFSGRTSNVNQWIEEFETECERFEILQDESKIEILKHLLDKQCLDWYTDASLEGIGAILKQIQPNGKEKPVAYFSKKLNEAQKKKKAIYLECLAIKEAVKYWQYWLIGKHFTVYSDHKPLENMNIKSRIDEELGEFTYYLSQYDFKIKYAPGKDNLEADCLSRNPVLEAVDDTDEQLRIVNLIQLQDVVTDQEKNENIQIEYHEAGYGTLFLAFQQPSAPAPSSARARVALARSATAAAGVDAGYYSARRDNIYAVAPPGVSAPGRQRRPRRPPSKRQAYIHSSFEFSRVREWDVRRKCLDGWG
ncbi:Retrovirus-related Pol polyprotein from transposon 412 [Eumeta japonica]|uniref:Retrovirus-related Pol polyprotein from transposon 412 n=1 Tax=Eumeta variegata TaxID=151549 RepID=A0A4C1SVT1_EUMVA|nr:Retrovirus-related Pol polyprotein from transposon 412 [Eumeta japonica]